MIKFNQQKVKEIAKKHSLKLLLVFGSQSSGKTHKFSDYDFGYISDSKKDIAKQSQLEDEIRKLVPKKEVDVVELDEITSLMKYEVLKNHIILYQRSNAYSDYFVRVLQEYFESKRLFDLQKQLIHKKIEKIKTNAL